MVEIHATCAGSPASGGPAGGMKWTDVPRLIIIAGLALVAIGAILHFAPWLLNWFGHLPGDIRIEHEHSRVLIPVTSMVLISVVLTILFNLFRR